MGQRGAILRQPQPSSSLRGAVGLAPCPSHRGSSTAGCASRWLAASSPDPWGLSGRENIMNSKTCTTHVNHFHQWMAVQLTSHLCGKLTFHTTPPTTAPEEHGQSESRMVAMVWAASQHTDSSKNTKAWATSQLSDTSKNTKAWATSQHSDTSRNTKAILNHSLCCQPSETNIPVHTAILQCTQLCVHDFDFNKS